VYDVFRLSDLASFHGVLDSPQFFERHLRPMLYFKEVSPNAAQRANKVGLALGVRRIPFAGVSTVKLVAGTYVRLHF
jgi:hypothetical protein